MAFKKGQAKPEGSGRGKGKSNGDTAKLRGLILGALDDAGGQKYLAQQAKDNPAAFMSLIGKVVPKEVEMNASLTINKMSDEELNQKLTELMNAGGISN